MSKVVPGEVVPGEVVPGEVVDVESPPAAVVDAQPPANEYGGVVEGHVVAVQPQKVHPEPRPQEDILAKRCECERRCECGIRPKRPTKKDGKPDYGFRWDGEVQKWVSNHRSNEAGGPPADGLPRHKKPAVGDLLIYFVFCPCAVGYFLWVSAPACWAALYAHVLAPVGGFVHDHLLVPLGKCLGACWDLLARACTALYKHVLVPIGTAVAAGAAAMGKCLGACWDLLARACTATYKHVLVPIGTAVAAGAAAMGKCLGACWDLLARACTATYKHVLVPIGTAVAAGAAATYKHVLVPIGTAVATGAAATYKHVLAPIGTAVAAGAAAVGSAMTAVGTAVAAGVAAFGSAVDPESG